MIISIIPVSASSDDYIIVKPMLNNSWIILFNNNIYLYNGTLYNITPKYILYINKTYSNDEIDSRYPYLNSFCLGNKTYVVFNAWDGCHIGKLDINNRTLYLEGRVLGQYYTLKSNNKEALACFDDKEGMRAEPIIVEFKYNKSSNSLEWVGDDFYGLNSKLADYLFNYVNHSKNYYFYELEIQPFSVSFDYNSKDKYWLIYLEGDLVVAYLEKDGRLNYVDNYISCLVKYNGTFYGYRSINFPLSQIVYDKYRNQWISVYNRKLYILDNNLSIVKIINPNKHIGGIFPVDKNNIYIIHYLGIEKINLNDGRITEIDLRNITPRYIAYNGKEFLLVGYDLSLYTFDGKTCKKVGSLNESCNENIQMPLNKLNNKSISSNNKTNVINNNTSKSRTVNYYLYGIIIIIYVIVGYILWKNSLKT
ncbi:hypothetical protein [Methanocaldococcus sp. FS406-22]|uniref:hypothetical protein n=1 Tax=Methanocaldococcus sp. (strain FS406-22) TaxID=644281 RepID=UPI001E2D2BF8|nr:hypothetical protein [Methanocaldococcus sp. FS406-22]